MPIQFWADSAPSGTNLTLEPLNEREIVTLPLPIYSGNGILINYKVIAGALPKGLSIIGSTITGTPFEVSRTTDYKFVVRAAGGGEISDRTFLITVKGSDEPNWLTPPGLLPVGENNTYFIIDSSFIDFQLVATDTDTTAGQKLNFFIASGEGELPPGIIMLPNGRLKGFVQPLLAVPQTQDEGFYSSGLYDGVAYDFGFKPTNGYDSYIYDFATYGFSVGTLNPRKLNRNYEFIATITDGDTITKRKFRIFVVGDDFFRADNVIMQAGTGAYTADVTYLRAPIFTTPKYLGLRRANNYQTFKIDIFEGEGNLGSVVYSLKKVNSLISAVARKDLSQDNRVGLPNLRIENAIGIPEIGQKISFELEIIGATSKIYTITKIDVLGGTSYRLTLDSPLDINIPNGQIIYIGNDSTLPPGVVFDPTTGEIFGTVPYQPAITTRYQFTIKATRLSQSGETADSRRVFTVDILGEVESVMNWISPSELGTIDVGFPSTLFVSASSTFQNSAILYNIEQGRLPPGLDLNLDGEIIGKVNQLRDQNTYKSYWKPEKTYAAKDIVKLDNINQVKSVVRRRNTATVVTQLDHNFNTDDIIKIASTELSFNSYSGVEIKIDNFKINSVQEIEGSGPYRVKFSIPTQQTAPLAPVFTLINGSAIATSPATYNNVGVKSTSRSGEGARFKIVKGNNGSTNPATYLGVTTITLLDPGTGYLPNDTIIISGASLGGADGLHDLSFVTSSGLEFYYNIIGNSNNNYNGRFFATASTTSTVTLNYENNPGILGSGLVSVALGSGGFEAQTQLIPSNYFSYPNTNSSVAMTAATGTLTGNPTYYIAAVNHVSGVTFADDNWKTYRFPESDQSLMLLDAGTTVFDNNDSSIDKVYTFTIKARDQLGYSAVSKIFSLKINIPNNAYYSNITARPFMKLEQRNSWKEFINNSSIFTPSLIYRLGDNNFGVQRSLSTLVFAGIETKQAVKYINAMDLNNKPKRFVLGNVKKAVAKEPGTNNVIYEVIYLDLLDPLEKGKIHLPFSTTNREGIVTFPSSISIWRKRLRQIEPAQKERNYLPQWMRSIQPGSFTELDWVPAVTLCFCKPGTADDILLNIKNSGFNFKLLDYTIDRYIIDSVEGYYEDKYLVFKK
jgi:hypothetical protein